MINDEITEQKKFVFDIAYLSECGGRPVNEDSVAVECGQNDILILVADGLGAHGGGDIASKIAVDTAKKEYAETDRLTSKNIYEIFRKIDDAIVIKQTEEVKMKTTLSCVLFKNNRVYLAHLGDTRIYSFKFGKIFFTADHSVAYEEVMKNKGTLNDIRKNSNRHILKAALGVGKIRPPDISKQRIKPNLSVLICSDGFWEYVNEDNMREALESTESSREWLEAMMKYHSEKTDEFNDNYSAVCVRIKKKFKEKKN
ncbi:MAG: serine/threonine-protein phosphatase [Oscillospiraceae bacterium]|nr:serine/threonine-protein phosphatase [Oscillospiraceae bacterium]